MKRRTTLFGAAMVACFAVALPMQDSRQDDSAKKIDALSRALDLEKRRTNEIEHRLDRIEAWFASVRTASEALDSAANDARRNGFESAGANPLARTNVLDGMKKFAAELTRTAPSAAPTAPK